ncbi:MAG: AAA family ATPase [Candidatus Thermoplasmatota archaeon]|nr:AAA family ATPase [Candidatus Thermoplasmatota archaeon]
MTLTLAVAGKGGVGKTTFAALAVRHLHESTKEVVLAVDADPNANLGTKLGTEPSRTLGGIREELLARSEEELPPGVSKQEHMDYQIRLAITEGSGFDLLTMGRQEGPGCYCYVNNLLRTIIDSLSTKYRYVVIDNEAGMEHLSRRTTRASDVLFVLCDRTKSSQSAARRISQLADEMKLQISRKALVFNSLDPGASGPPVSSLEGFHAVYGVRRSGMMLSRAEETESLADVPRTDPTFSDVAKAVESERLRG